MTPAEIILILGALGAGGVVTQIAAWLVGRKRQDVDLTAALSEASQALVRQYSTTNDELRREVADMKQQLVAVRVELQHVLDLVGETRAWAQTNGHHDAPVLRTHDTPIGGVDHGQTSDSRQAT